MSKIPQYDDRGVIDKLSSGDIGAINRTDLANVGDVALSTAGYVEKFVPAVGDIIPYSTPIGVGLDAVRSIDDNRRRNEEVAQYFDPKTIRQIVRRNPKLADKFEKDFDGVGFLGKAGALLGGASLGGTAATLLSIVIFPPIAFTVAPIVGAIAGGSIANKMYNAAFEKHEQDPVIITMQIADMKSKGEYVPPEIVFAALAANSPEKFAKKIDERLEEYTDTKLFTEALSDHKNIPKLRAMMVAFDNQIRAQTKMPQDSQNPFKTVAEQYADMINSGQMKAQDLLRPDAGVGAMLAMARGQEQNVEVPITPEARQNHISRT
ncbi:MAG: hypothetical protein ABL867_06430 [Rickettsiales bacterium]